MGVGRGRPAQAPASLFSATARGLALGLSCFHGPEYVNQAFILLFLLKFSFVLAPAEASKKAT